MERCPELGTPLEVFSETGNCWLQGCVVEVFPEPAVSIQYMLYSLLARKTITWPSPTLLRTAGTARAVDLESRRLDATSELDPGATIGGFWVEWPPEGKQIIHASVGEWHTVLLLDDGTVKTFWNQGSKPRAPNYGRKDYGQTIIPDLGGKKVIHATAGGCYTVLVMDDGTVRAFGANDHMRAELPHLRHENVIHAAAGDGHTVLVLDDGTVKAVGANAYGQTTLPNLRGKKVIHAAAGGFHSIYGHTVLVLDDGTVRAFGCKVTESHQVTEMITLQDLRGKKVIHAAAGGCNSMRGHTVLVLSDGTVRAFGCTGRQITFPDLEGKTVIHAAAGMSHTVLVLDDGTVRAFGGESGEITLPDLEGKKVIRAAAGYNYTVLILSDGSAVAFGNV
jgi:hypothetical protein